jgi:hypothetical protein
MALIAYGGFIAFLGLALFDRHPLAGGIAVLVGLSVAALGHTGADGRGPGNRASG